MATCFQSGCLSQQLSPKLKKASYLGLKADALPGRPEPWVADGCFGAMAKLTFSVMDASPLRVHIDNYGLRCRNITREIFERPQNRIL